MLLQVNLEADHLKLYSSTIEEPQEPKESKSVKFQTKGQKSRVVVFGGNKGRYDDKKENNNYKKRRRRGKKARTKVSKVLLLEAWLEPIRNPVTGKFHRAIIEIPDGF